MTSRERMLAAIHHTQPDRVPALAHLTSQVAEPLAARVGSPAITIPSMMPVRVSYNELLLDLGNDAVCVGVGTDEGFTPVHSDDGAVTDEWGFTSKLVGKYAEIVGRPLGNVSTEAEIRDFTIPSPDAPGRWTAAKRYIHGHKDTFAIFGFLPQVMFESSWNLVGFEKYLMDFFSKEPYVIALLDRLLEFATACGTQLVEMGVDVLWVGDDVGAQDNMLISPDLWREILKPRMKWFFETMKSLNPDLKIIYHSCGAIRPIIPELIEIGLDILNPLQPLARDMDIAELKTEFGKDLALCGGIDVQEVLPTGTTAEVKAHVLDRVRKASEGGGYIASPAHVIQPDTPIENVLAYFEAVKESEHRG